MKTKPITAIALTAATLAASCLAQPARAGTYEVYACGPAGSTQNLFRPHATSALMNAYTICPASNIATGVATKVTSSGGTVPHLGGAFQIFDAPNGARVESVRMSIAELRMDPSWTVGIVGYDNFDQGQLIFGCGAFGPGCDVATPSFYGPVEIPGSGQQSFRLETRCGNTSGCSAASSGKTPANRALFSATEITVRVGDGSPPNVNVAGPVWVDGWQSGTRRLIYAVYDNVGNRSNRVEVDGRVVAQDDFADNAWPANLHCDYTRPRPCGDVDYYRDLDTQKFSDGNHVVRFVAVDAAGNSAVRQRTISVDNTAPGRVGDMNVEGGFGWRRDNSFEPRWSNPAGQVSPIAAARYRLCKVGSGGECSDGRVAGAGIDRLSAMQLPGRGDYEFRVWPEDAAGNTDQQHASDPVRMRFDDRPPEGSFDPLNPEAPAIVSAALVDRESAVATAGFELRRDGSSVWQDLATEMQGDHAVAQINDADLPDGVYRLRLRASDLAGNELLTSTRSDGSTMTLRLPLRLGSRIEASVRSQAKASRKCVKRKRRKRGKPRRVCRKRVQQVAVAGDGNARLNGTLMTADGEPLASETVAVRERVRSQSRELRTHNLKTDRLGRFSYSSGAGPSRSVMFEYQGTRFVKPTTGRIDLAVAARSTIKAKPRAVRNGRTVALSGRLLGDFLPTGGKLVALQAHFRGRWRTFATPRADAKGHWHYRYRFGATSGVVKYALRALVPLENAYPYEAGHSKSVHVVVRG